MAEDPKLSEEAKKEMLENQRLLEKELDLIKKVRDAKIDIRDAGRDLIKETADLNMLNDKSKSLQEELLKVSKENTYESLQREFAIKDQLKFLEKEIKYANQSKKIAEDRYQSDIKANKELGIAGSLMKNLSGKSEFASRIFEAMNEQAKGLANGTAKSKNSMSVLGAGLKAAGRGATEWWKSTSMGVKAISGIGVAMSVAQMAGDALGGAMKKTGGIVKGLSEDSSDFFSNLTGPVNEMLEKIPIVGGLLSGIVSFWTSILDLIVGVEDRIVKSGRQLGLTTSQAYKLNDSFAEMAKNSDKAYVNSKALMQSQLELTSATGLNNIASQQNLETNMELAKFAGLEAQSRANIYEASIATGVSMREITKNVAGQVGNLSEATGISFNYQKVLAEAASQSGRLGLMFVKYPQQLTKSLIAVKALGLELKQLESIGDSMLDFESSIAKEFEVQLLLGKEINLNKAREAFLNNDLVTAAMEITKHTGDANGFLKLNRIQQQSLAEAMGMSVEGMSEFLKKQEVMIKLGAKDNRDLMEKVKLSQQNNAEKRKMIDLIGEEQYKNLVNLSTQERLMESFDKIKQSIVDFLTKSNVLEKIQYYVEKLSNPENIRSIVNYVKSMLSDVIDFVASVTGGMIDVIESVGDFFIWNSDKQKKWTESFDEIREKGSSIYGRISENLGAGSSTSKIQNTKDGVIFPGSNLVVNKDPLDYTIFTKNPSALSAPMEKETVKQIVSEAVAAVVRDRPIVVHTHTNLNLDGQVAAKSSINSMKNNPLMGFDRTFGPMALNT